MLIFNNQFHVMKKYSLLVLLLFNAFNTFSKSAFKMHDTVNVWLMEGIHAYHDVSKSNKPSYLVIPYGAKVVVLDTTLSGKPVSKLFKNMVAKQPYSLTGYWVLVSYNHHKGLVFSGYLSKMPCFYKARLGFETEGSYLRRTFGKPKVIVKKTVVKHQPLIITTNTYNNGIKEIVTQYDGCSDVELHLNNITYQEALLFEEVWMQQGDAAEDIKIKMMANRRVRLSLSSCD